MLMIFGVLMIDDFRYLHYYNRYINHMQSLKFEHKLYSSVKLKMEEMQQHNMSWIEVSRSLMIEALKLIVLLAFRFSF